MKHKIPKINIESRYFGPPDGYFSEKVGKYIIDFPVLEQFHTRVHFHKDISNNDEDVLNHCKKGCIFGLVEKAHVNFPGKMFRVLPAVHEKFNDKFVPDALHMTLVVYDIEVEYWEKK